MSDEDKAKPSKSVMGNLPSTRPQRANSCGDWRSTVSNGTSCLHPFVRTARSTASAKAQ